MNCSRAATAATAAALLVSAVVAQDPDPGLALQALRTPLHRAPIDAVGPAPGLWAAGADYKAGFSQGMVFVPYLGEAAAENAEFRWQTLGYGAQARLRAPAVEPDRSTGFHCEYDLGPVTEAYDVLAQGLEQTFVLGAEPDGAGDVELRGAVGGNLHAIERPAAHGPIDFLDRQGRCVVRYGAASAVDAAGRATALATSFTDGIVTIHLPRLVLQQAAYPLVVDPLLSPVLLATSSGNGFSGWYRNLAIERDDRSPSANVMVAFARVASLVDTDVTALLCDDDFGNPVTVFADLDPSVDRDQPVVAFVGGPGTWVLVLARTVGGYTGCRYHLHPRGSPTLGTAITAFTAPNSERETRPRVGGSRRATGGTTALLVRQRDPASTPGNTATTSIVASVLDPATNSESTPVLVDGGALVDAENPVVSKDADGGSWMIAWQSWRGLLASRWQVRAQRIDPQGTLSSGTLFTDRAAFGMHEVTPRVDGCAGRYLLVFGEVSSSLFPGKITGDSFVQGRSLRFDWSETSATPDRTLASRFVIGNVDRALVFGGLSYDTETRSHWALGTISVNYGNTYLQILGYRGMPAYLHQLFTPSPNGSSAWQAACFDDDHRRFLTVVATTAVAAGGNGYGYSVTGRAYEYPLPAAVWMGGGCSPANISGQGRFQRGHEFPSVDLSGAPANTFALLCVSLQQTSIALDLFGLPGCTLLVDPGSGNFAGLGTVTDSQGRAAAPFPLPETLADMDVWFQWAHFAPGANAAEVLLTAGLQAQIR